MHHWSRGDALYTHPALASWVDQAWVLASSTVQPQSACFSPDSLLESLGELEQKMLAITAGIVIGVTYEVRCCVSGSKSLSGPVVFCREVWTKTQRVCSFIVGSTAGVWPRTERSRWPSQACVVIAGGGGRPQGARGSQRAKKGRRARGEKRALGTSKAPAGEAGGLHWWPRTQSRSRVASSRQTLTGVQVPRARRPGRTGAREPRVQLQETRMVVNWWWSNKLLITSDLFIPVYSLGAPLGAAYSK